MNNEINTAAVTAPKTALVHRWQDLGLGVAPFTAVCVLTIPSPSIAEQNPTGYNNALADLSASCRTFGIAAGCCDACGQSLVNNFVIRDARGKHFVVGCDCAEKTGDAKPVTETEKLERERKREIRRAKSAAAAVVRRAEREARLEAERAANGGLTEWEVAEQARLEAEAARVDARMAKVGHVVEMLERGEDFQRSLAAQLRVRDLSDRQADYAAKWCVGTTGRRNQKNAAEWDAFCDLVTGYEEEA